MNAYKIVFKNTVLTALQHLKKASSNILNFYLMVFYTIFLTISAHADTNLADKPLFSTLGQTANVALALSVEFPTALGSAYTTSYDNTTEYLGYWDANKCYSYYAGTFQGPYNTGVNNSNVLQTNGTTDLHWSVTSKPSGVTTTNSQLITLNTSSGSDSDSSYIGYSTGNGNYTYSTTFTIPTTVDPTQVSISFTLWADDSLVQVLVNGTDTGITNSSIAYNVSGTITIPAGTFTTTGSQTLALKINNTGGFGGLRVDDMVTKASTDGSYFVPQSLAATNHVCNAGSTPYWSGNYLNWALTQTIDPFRFALSGGYRAVDKVGLTVLEKAYASGQGGTVATPTITNNQTLIAQSTPFTNLTTLAVRISGLGTKFYFTQGGSLSSPGTNLVVDGGVPASPVSTKVYEMYARVKVCDPTLLESNCTKYSSTNYKPEGLIQKNSKKLNFAAFGYLMDDSNTTANLQRDGGVLRARMAPLGPIKKLSDSTEVTNPNPEWSDTTGIFYTNPDPTDATASSVSQSGVINYLNKFGLTAGSYKRFDPVGELYYTATRYFKNLGNVSAYTSGINTSPSLKDGFPVITTWDDPIQNACQANFILGVGDTNTHADVNLPGSTIRSSNEPALPSEVSSDTSVDARVATNKVGALENISGYTNLGEKYTPWCCNNNGFMMAGLAYDNHTKDIRPSSFLPSTGSKTTIQTIDTYWLDVLESGDYKNYNNIAGMRNQYWLAAKYGGFTVPSGYSPYSATTAPATSAWDNNNDGDPDNYYRANNPALMIKGLTKAFDAIVIKAGIGTSDRISVVSPAIVSGDISVAASYVADGWTGDVTGSLITFDSTGAIVQTQIWSAATKLGAQDWSAGRSVATAKCATLYSDGTKLCTGVPFRTASNLLAANATDLTATGNTAQDTLNFLRGDRSKEDNTYFRKRTQVLGDIGNSRVILVGKPSGTMSDALNPGYSTFKSTYASRPTVAYVGANDGMLHAFNAASDSTGGNELFAYVPSMLFNGPNATPASDGLVALSKIPYVHHQYVDATPIVQDVNFGGGDSDWHSLLVGGLGKGGKGYYALDVTDPATLTSESALASAVKWEFTHQHMGYSYGTPVIAKIKNTSVGYNGWVVIVTSGYNTPDKNGYFFVLNAKTGALIKEIKTYASAPSTDAGLATPNVLLNDAQNYNADAAYAGDLLGNVWRLNLNDFTVVNFASLKDDKGQAQPITTKVRLAVSKSTSNRYVLVGTGRLLDDSDAGNSQTQSVYAIIDGYGTDQAYFGTNTALPSGVSFPITRANLNNNSVLYATTGVTSPATNSVGWYIDLADNYIVNVDMQVNAGVLYLGANSVVGGACGATNSNRKFTLLFGSGKTAASVAYTQGSGLIKDITFYRNATTSSNSAVNATAEVQTGTGGENQGFPGGGASSGLNFKQLNWRDLPTAD